MIQTRTVRSDPVSVDEALAARAGAEPLLAGVLQHVHQQGAVHLVGKVQGRVTLWGGGTWRSPGGQSSRVGGASRLHGSLTLMFWASTLAPAASSTCAESTFPASTAQCSGVLRFSLSAALTEAWFLIRKLLGSDLATDQSINQSA